MDISLNWLEEWIDLDGIAIDELAHRLTMAGLEVDGLDEVGRDEGDIVVGRIVEIEPHPDADRLVICRVDVGGDELLQIACGADNMASGDLVPTALPGSRPPALDFDVETRELMGIASEGMLCSAEELDLAESSEGLMILPSDLKVGTPVFEALDVADTVFELDLTPNRSDCLSHFGVAREVSALIERPLRRPEDADRPPLWRREASGGDVLEAADLEVRDVEGCPRYAFAVLEDVEVGPSPFWLRRRLNAIGLRSVNNIVDVTNFILMDVGQPLHAFDLDTLNGSSIVVRRAQAGETLEAIDHETYELDEDDLVVADASKPVALAGVIGGAETEVSESTSRVLLECAFFDPRTVRRTSKRHDIHTDSSHRFERRTDPIAVERSLDRALQAIVRTQATLPDVDRPTIRSNVAIADDSDEYDEHWTVELPLDLPTRSLGIDLDPDEARSMLERLHLYPEAPEDDALPVRIPSFRGDLRRPIDLVEEIARLHGYDRMDEELPTRKMGESHTPRPDAEHEPTLLDREDRSLLNLIRQRLLDAGLSEVLNDSFMSDEDLERLRAPEESRLRETVEIANPVRSSDRYMQTTVLPSLLGNLADNRARNIDDVAIFEVARRYGPEREVPTLGLLATGEVAPHWDDDRRWDFFDLKGLVELIGRPFELKGAQWREPDTSAPWLHPGIEAEWRLDGDRLARVGRLHPEVARDLEVDDAPVVVAEVAIERLIASDRRRLEFQPYSHFPPVERDVALLVDEELSYQEVVDSITSFQKQHETFDELVESVELFDVYEGEQVPEGRQSLAFSVVYRADDRSLTEDEIEPLDAELESWLEDDIGATRR